MTKSELLSHLTQDRDQRLLLSHALDQMEAAQRRSMPTHTAFLTPAEAILLERAVSLSGGSRYVLIGGYEEAERRICVFLPDWMEEENLYAEDYITALRATWYAEEKLSHRDFLGALMGMGVRRETVGDILVTEGSCDLLLLPEVQPFLESSFDHAGHSKLHLQKVEPSALHFPEKQVKAVNGTVATLRLDAVAATGFSVSRAKMAEAIAAGRVTLNWQTVMKSDQSVAEGDVIACRGLGKCKLVEVGGLSRKGRVSVRMERFV